MRGMGFFTIFGQEKEATIAMGLFFLGSIVSRLVLAGTDPGDGQPGDHGKQAAEAM